MLQHQPPVPPVAAVHASRKKALIASTTIVSEMAAYSTERLPLLSQSPTRSVRHRNTVVAAISLALIALSLLAVDARSGFAHSTSLRGSLVSFPNGDLKTITVLLHRWLHFIAEVLTSCRRPNLFH
jgi:hypothetical protein